MINCPRCKANLPDWTKICQFCHNDLSNVARPTPIPGTTSNANYGATPTWIWFAYYAISVYFLCEGVADIIKGCQIQPYPKTISPELAAALGPPSMGIGNYIQIVVGVITVIVGIGLLLRIEFIRGVVNFFCGLSIFVGLYDLAISVLAFGVSPLWGGLLILYNVFNIATAGLMIYLIGETDRYCTV